MTWVWRASWLLLPIAFVARLVAPERHVLVFTVSCLSLSFQENESSFLFT